MKRALLVAAALVAVSLPITPAAQAAPPSDTDRICGIVSMTDPNPEAPDATVLTAMYAGPILQNGTVTCTYTVAWDSHDAPSALVMASQSATGRNGATTLEPIFISHRGAPPLTPTYLCTRFSDGATTYYYDAPTRAWTTNPSSACALTISAGTDDPVFDPVFGLLDTVADTLTEIKVSVGDPVACPVLAALAGAYTGLLLITPQGDVYLNGEAVWDCPPYDLGLTYEVPIARFTVNVVP